MYSYISNQIGGGDVFKLAEFFSHRLDAFLAPLLKQLDEALDKRLVDTFSGLCQSIIRLRSRSTGLLLSELGAIFFLLIKHRQAQSVSLIYCEAPGGRIK